MRDRSLALTARDMIKIGELWLNGGVWHGRRILDADYISQASGPRARWQDPWLRVSLVVHTAGDARVQLAARRACTGS